MINCTGSLSFVEFVNIFGGAGWFVIFMGLIFLLSLIIMIPIALHTRFKDKEGTEVKA